MELETSACAGQRPKVLLLAWEPCPHNFAMVNGIKHLNEDMKGVLEIQVRSCSSIRGTER